MIRKIITVKDPLLRSKSKPVKKIDKKILRLVKDMKDTLATQTDPEGVALAAPQVGKILRVFVINHEGLNKAFINPKVITQKTKLKKPQLKESTKKASAKDSKSTKKDDLKKKKKSQTLLLEGCLSLPNFYTPIDRDGYVKIKYQDESGKERVEDFKGFFAQIIQHEIDHLNGVIFIDRLLEQKKPLYKLSGQKWEEVELI
jgi:peptide deformylase